MNPTFTFKAIQGRPDFGNPKYRSKFFEYLLENEGRWFEIKIRKSKRTLSQNSFYRVYLNVISQETGQDTESLHKLFKSKFLTGERIEVIINGESHEIIDDPTTTILSKNEMSEYMYKIEEMTGIPIPDPKLLGY